MGAPFALPPGRVWASRPPDQPLRHVRTMRMAEDLLPDATGIARAAALLRAGALVALPSETVYGLAADATQDSAVAAIYTAKGRPDFNPLIVHLPDLDSAMAIADFPGTASALADAFWPGPLTLVLPLKPGHGLSARVTAGHATVAIRLPVHPVMQAVLQAAALPIAAPLGQPIGQDQRHHGGACARGTGRADRGHPRWWPNAGGGRIHHPRAWRRRHKAPA